MNAMFSILSFLYYAYFILVHVSHLRQKKFASTIWSARYNVVQNCSGVARWRKVEGHKFSPKSEKQKKKKKKKNRKKRRVGEV